jgi:aconitase B
MGWHDEGKGRLKALVALSVMAATIYLGFKIIPIYINNYDLSQHIQQVAVDATVHRTPAENITKDVVAYAGDLGLPITADNVKVKVGSIVTIDLDYTVPVDLKVYTLMLHFTPSAENRQI